MIFSYQGYILLTCSPQVLKPLFEILSMSLLFWHYNLFLIQVRVS